MSTWANGDGYTYVGCAIGVYFVLLIGQWAVVLTIMYMLTWIVWDLGYGVFWLCNPRVRSSAKKSLHCSE